MTARNDARGCGPGSSQTSPKVPIELEVLSEIAREYAYEFWWVMSN